MKITPDRLAVARAVRDEYGGKRDDWSESHLERLLKAIPEPSTSGGQTQDGASLNLDWAPTPLTAGRILREVQAEINAARAEEREACAKIADLYDNTEKWGIEGAGMANMLSQMIRARSGARGV